MLDPLVLVLPGLIAFLCIRIYRKPTWPTRRWSITFASATGGFLRRGVIWCGDQYLNGFLNSASTLFSMGIYRRIITRMPSRNSWSPSGANLVSLRHRFGDGRAVDRQRAAGAVYWMKQLNGIYNVPLVTIIIMAFSSRAFRRWRQKWRWGLA